MFDPRFPFQAPVLPKAPGAWPAPPPAMPPSTTAPGTQPGTPSIGLHLPPIGNPSISATPPAPVAKAPVVAPIAKPPAPVTTTPQITLADGTDTDVLAHLLGAWTGDGFNAIWVPNTLHGHFLMLDMTKDHIKFDDIQGPIPNRGLLQPDINMRGITYYQQIRNADSGNTMHIEPGLWATVPETSHPHVAATAARLGSIPHGTSILAQGLITFGKGKPVIPNNDIIAFAINQPAQRFGFLESTLATPSAFRSQSKGVTQPIIDNPNSLLQAAIQNIAVDRFIKIDVTTDTSVAPGGGVANTAFLQGVTGEAPNAVAQKVSSTFWIEFFKKPDGSDDVQLQYTQTVLLNFGGLSWPHVTVGTLRRDVGPAIA